MSGALFYALEQEVYRPAVAGAAASPHGTRPRGVRRPAIGALESTETLRASDTGYRTRSTDVGGLAVFPPILGEAFAMDRRLTLPPAQARGSVSYGSATLSNVRGVLDSLTARNSDGRPVRVLAGRRTFDPVRAIYLDPPRAALAPVFAGVSAPWVVSDTDVAIPLRGADYLLAQAMQSNVYGGTGGLDGGSDLTGKPKPMVRGGYGGLAVQNVTPVLVDAVRLIYQYTDGPGSVGALSEGGVAGGFSYQGNVSDLYAGTTNPGSYRTDNARGLFQMGSSPVRALTLDAYGSFAAGGAITTPVMQARQILTEILAVPPALLHASWGTADRACAYLSGFALGTTAVQADGLVSQLLASVGAKLAPRRDGTLGVVLLRALAADARPADAWDEAVYVTLRPTALPAPLDPPPYRWRWGYLRNATVQTSDLTDTITAPRRGFLAEEYRYALWASNAVLQAWRKPSDPDPVPSLLLDLSQAQDMANAMGALWAADRSARRLFEVTLPIERVLPRELGDVVALSGSGVGLVTGSLGIIVGEQLRAGDGVATMQVLV